MPGLVSSPDSRVGAVVVAALFSSRRSDRWSLPVVVPRSRCRLLFSTSVVLLGISYRCMGSFSKFKLFLVFDFRCSGVSDTHDLEWIYIFYALALSLLLLVHITLSNKDHQNYDHLVNWTRHSKPTSALKSAARCLSCTPFSIQIGVLSGKGGEKIGANERKKNPENSNMPSPNYPPNSGASCVLRGGGG